MRVLHLIKTNAGAGWAFREIKYLSGFGIENMVVLPSSSEGFAKMYVQEGIKIIPARIDLTQPPSNPFRKILKLMAIIKREKPDIVHSHFAGTTATARLALLHKKELPMIFQIPGPLHLENPLTRLLDVKTIRTRDYYIATVDYVKRLLLRSGVPRERVFLSYYGTEVSTFKPTRTGKLRSQLKLNEKTPLIGMVAYMYPPKRLLGQRFGIKGHEYFIKAISLLLEDYRDLKAVVIGSQWGGGHHYENYLKQIANELCGEAVIFTGCRNDVQFIYPDLDVAVHPSISENAGGAVESLLCCVPTVASNIGGLADVIEDGVTGLKFKPGSPEDLARAVRLILEDPIKAKSMAQEGMKRMREIFDVRKTARQVREIYEQILSEG